MFLTKFHISSLQNRVIFSERINELMLKASLQKMVFLCQKDSYLKQSTLKVLSCQPSKQKKFKNAFEVEFSEALIFPEGGGQPADHGTVYENTTDSKEIPIVSKIINSYRAGEKAIAISDKPLAENHEYKLILDYERRFDHMQQHTGQHLISAIAEKEPFNLPTTLVMY